MEGTFWQAILERKISIPEHFQPLEFSIQESEQNKIFVADREFKQPSNVLITSSSLVVVPVGALKAVMLAIQGCLCLVSFFLSSLSPSGLILGLPLTLQPSVFHPML